MKNLNIVNVLIISSDGALGPFCVRKKLKNVTKKFGGLRKSRTFALPLKSGYAERVRVLHKTGAENKFERFLKKRFGSLEIMRTFAAPFEKRVSKEKTTSSLKRLKTVQEASTEKIQFIEKR